MRYKKDILDILIDGLSDFLGVPKSYAEEGLYDFKEGRVQIFDLDLSKLTTREALIVKAYSMILEELL